MEIGISNMSITDVGADLIVLKHADGFYGADAIVASTVGFNEPLAAGDFRFMSGEHLAARQVLFIGVGPLHKFRYKQIQEFAERAVKLARTGNDVVRHLALTIHGPGYGLDPEQALLSLVAGLVAAWRVEPGLLDRITIAERSLKRCELLRRVLRENWKKFAQQNDAGPDVAHSLGPSLRGLGEALAHFGERVERKARLFIAMPFSEEFTDEFEIAFLESAKANGYICERLDLEIFSGDIVSEIKSRILSSDGVIALLNGGNPNVFLEIGFAWGHDKTTILVGKHGASLPFDVRGQRCVIYKNIKHLRDALTKEIAGLKAQGMLTRG